tara:strand:+ start:6266 stop:7198 length:933 start_codon:yes stop_codon:yes gene_type:complete
MEQQPKINRIQWLFGNMCNYDCSYCPTILHSNDSKFDDPDIIANAVQYTVSSLRMLDRKPSFEFVGGEPTLNPGLLAICQRMGNQKLSNKLTTNGSASIEWWEEYYVYFSQVEISYHTEFANLEHIEKVIDFLIEKELAVKVMVHCTHLDDQWNKAIHVYQILKNKGYKTELKLLFSNFTKGFQFYPYKTYQLKYYFEEKGQDWDPEQTMYTGNLKYDGHTHARHDMNREFVDKKDGRIKNNWNYKGWRCNAGVDQFIVDKRGNVRRGWCGQGERLGNVLLRDVQWLQKAIKCDLDVCRNGFDQLATKFK